MSSFQIKTYDLHGYNEEKGYTEILSILFELQSKNYTPYSINIITGKGDGVMQNALFNILDGYDNIECKQINEGKYELSLLDEKIY